jgi:hypothetical protein
LLKSFFVYLRPQELAREHNNLVKIIEQALASQEEL